MAANPLDKDVPELFKARDVTCVTLAEAANYYISLGEAEAIKKLKGLEEGFGDSRDRGFGRNARIGWVCRIIFEGKGDKPIRQPYYGGLLLPYLTMPLTEWPQYPVAESEGVYFVLADGYMLAGVAEEASDYIDYCSNNGTFRKTKVNVPSKADAISAFNSINDSIRWKKIKWKDESPGSTYTMSEDWTLDNLKAQTNIANE